MPEKSTKEKLKLDEHLNLKNDFEIPTFDKWKAQVEKDLKGASYEKKLITKTYEDIDLQPIYTKKDLENLTITDSLPGFYNFLRGSSPGGYFLKSWCVNQKVKIADSIEYNKSILHALNNGQNCVNLSLDTATKLGIDADYAGTEMVGDCGLSISGIKSLERALNNINFTSYPINVNTGLNLLPFLSLLLAHFKLKNILTKNISGAITIDPLAHLAVYGEMPVSFNFIFDQIRIANEWLKNSETKLKIIEVSSLPYANSGADAVQELAFAMSTAVFYLNELSGKGISINEIVNGIQFKLGIGTNYFMEIAKLRAVRILWSSVAKEYGVNPETLNITVNAESSGYYQTNLDPYVNLLRSTTETFSAILGGVQGITTAPFDESIRQSDEFSERIARNTQTILREESHLDQVIDPAGGSFYIETLTKKVAEKAWKLFQEIESKGGMLEALESNFIQNLIKETVEKREKDINKRKSVIVGANMYADINEKQLDENNFDQEAFKKKRADYLQKYRLNGSQEKHTAVLESLNSISDLNSPEIIEQITDAFINGATIGEVTKSLTSAHKDTLTIRKVNIKRASEGFEQLRKLSRDYKNKTGSLPKIFLANMGTIKEYKARADFSKGFFEVGGFETIYPTGFLTVDEAVSSAIKSNCKIIVICSTDDKYPGLVPGITQKLKSHNAGIQIVLAGYPKEEIERYKEAGVDEFIFLGADVMKILTTLHNKLGGTK